MFKFGRIELKRCSNLEEILLARKQTKEPQEKSYSTDSSSGTIRYDKYFSPTKLSEITTNLNQQDFFAVHFNARSLSKNKDNIEDFFIGNL